MNHIAIRVNDIEWYIEFFSQVFGSKVEKTNGEDQIWLDCGLQLNKTDDRIEPLNGLLDHIAFVTNDVEGCLARAKKYDIRSMDRGEHWFQLPTGLCIELLEPSP